MKQIYLSSRNKQGGFSILGVILVVVAIVGALGVWAMSGQTNTGNAASSSADVMGSGIVNDGSAIKTSFDTLLVNGSSAANITFIPNTAGVGTNMLDPTSGIQKPTPNAGAFINSTFPNAAWIYNGTTFKANGVGTAAADQTMFLLGVKDTICSQINSRLYGAGTVAPVSTFVEATVAGAATAAAPTSAGAADLTGVAAAAGWMSGCVTTAGGADHNMYFRVLKAN
jgi:hypothetical protein